MSRGWLMCERIGGSVFAAFVICGGAVGATLGVVLGNPVWYWAIAIVGGWLALTALLVWSLVVYDRLAYEAMSWSASPDRFEFRKGVWWRKAITVPRARVQHTDVEQGPLMRRYRIAKLVIHTAGTQYAKVDVPGLEKETADRLRDWLIDGGVRRG